MIIETIPVAGTNRMYTSGWPQNQNRCWYRITLPPWAGLKKAVPNRRSSSRRPVAKVTAGTANITMNAIDRIDHTKIGTRFTVIPGARILKAVTMKFTAPTVVEMPMNTTADAQKSMLMPGENALAVRGV